MIETRRHTGRGIEIGQPHRDNAAGLPVACYAVTSYASRYGVTGSPAGSMSMSNAERQRMYRQRHLTDVNSSGARLNLIVDLRGKTRLERLARCYGVTLREVILLVADEAETALLDTLSADQRVAYYAGKLALRRNSDEPPSGDGKGNDDPLRRNADDRDQRIIRMFAEGTSKRAIAREIGCSDGTVRNVILRHQVDAG